MRDFVMLFQINISLDNILNAYPTPRKLISKILYILQLEFGLFYCMSVESVPKFNDEILVYRLRFITYVCRHCRV